MECYFVEPKITMLCFLNLSLCERVLYQYKDEQDRLREIFFKNCTHYFLDGMINIKNPDPNKIKIDEKSNIYIVY